MKKLFLVAAFAMVSAFASAQFAVGVHTLYGTDVSNLGIGVRARYDLNLMVTLTTTSRRTIWNFGISMPTCITSLILPTSLQHILLGGWVM